MKYISTRGGIEPISFKQAVMMGLARDGGLLLPETLPVVDEDIQTRWRSLSYPDLALEVMKLFISDISEDTLKHLINISYQVFDTKEVTPVVALKDFFLLELFHGPTLAFKDIALQLLGNMFEYLLTQENKKMNILGATSGDTGSAAIYGVRGRKNINIFILHPHGRVSPIQALQMTTVPEKNVFNIAIEGTFDDCQAIVKAIFSDLEFKDKYQLGAVNSINWARVLAQVVYYIYAYFRVSEQTGTKQVTFSVPTGNFGDIFAGYIAKNLLSNKIYKLILATNENDILTRFVCKGEYKLGSVIPTISPSMDIQIASNFERYLFYLYNRDSKRVKEVMLNFSKTGCITFSQEEQKRTQKDFISESINQDETIATIADVYSTDKYILDPHTAVGVCAAQKLRNNFNDIPIICLATAHPAKFPDAVKRAIGKDPDRPDALKDLEKRKQRLTVLPADISKVKDYISQNALI